MFTYFGHTNISNFGIFPWSFRNVYTQYCSCDCSLMGHRSFIQSIWSRVDPENIYYAQDGEFSNLFGDLHWNNDVASQVQTKFKCNKSQLPPLTRMGTFKMIGWDWIESIMLCNYDHGAVPLWSEEKSILSIKFSIQSHPFEYWALFPIFQMYPKIFQW